MNIRKLDQIGNPVQIGWLTRWCSAAFVAMCLVLGITPVVSAAPSTQGQVSASGHPGSSVGSCGTWDCTIYFSRSETRGIAGVGGIPPVPWYMPWQVKAAYYGGIYGLRWFAQQYANRGWCSAYRISLVPWASQGYTGYACNWG